MRPLLAEQGAALWTPTYTGVGERSHLLGSGLDVDLDLDTHIADMVQVLEYEDLREVVLVAHSYGGMVATGVLDRVPDRIRSIIYLDAFVPGDGQSLLDLLPDEVASAMRAAAEGARTVPPNPVPPDTDPVDVEWITQRRGPQPLDTFTQPLQLTSDTSSHPRSYIYCLRSAPGDVFGRFAEAARGDPAWAYREIDASHSPHVTAPAALRDLLLELAKR